MLHDVRRTAGARPAAEHHPSYVATYVSIGTILPSRSRDFDMMLLAPFPFFVGSLFIIASASEANDRCSKDRPCTPSEDGDPSFCDYQIGPSAGGYCVACEGRQTYLCSAEELGLAESGVKDCEDKCSFKSCAEPCDDGYFCTYENYQDGPCQPCETLVVHPDECDGRGFIDNGVEQCVERCPQKSCSKRSHCASLNVKYFCNYADQSGEGSCERCAGMRSIDECNERSASDAALKECIEVCEDAVITSCTTNEDCKGRERFFCNSNTTTCQECPNADLNSDWHVSQCLNSTYHRLGLIDEPSQNNCADACQTSCKDIREGSIFVQDLYDVGKEGNLPMLGTPYTIVSGPLVDCQFGGEGECSPDAPDNFICLISRGVRKFSDKALNCKDMGGIGVILYNNEENNAIVEGYVGDEPVEIPITAISLKDGLTLLESGLGLEATVDLKKTGDDCDIGCSDSITCPLGQYCDYTLDSHGYCQECLSDEDEQRSVCFLSGLPLRGAQECASTCESTLTSKTCKICGSDVSGISLEPAKEGVPACNFCPDGLKRQFWENEIPFIGSNATCYKLNQFFLNYQLPESNDNCQLALNFNYICDCEGPGYAGADNYNKKMALVWVPRVSAILSFIGSCAIIIDVLKDRNKRQKVYCQLMASMSIFDLMGSVAYSLTTIPIPKEYYIEGSMGNEASCTAQGFFIQMGTTSAFLNVSLAIYYFSMIRLGHTETRIKRNRIWLFSCPIVVGLAYAFAGIPFYDMLFLWCNNSANWWPDIPILVAIVGVTCIMGSMCIHVYKTEKKSQSWTTASMRRAFSAVVVWQSLWYLMSFYLTWPPYLALQYLWAAGKGYSSYGFTLFACTLVPLQGFWNSVVYFRVRVKKMVSEAASNMLTGSNMSWVMFSRHSSQAEGKNVHSVVSGNAGSQAEEKNAHSVVSGNAGD